MKRVPPAIVLFFLAPAIGELLSGSAPPFEFFNPFGLIVLSALYGSGALLVRELSLCWGKRWPTIFTLGLTYGILEEGIMVKSFFDPAWPDLGILGVYGRWGGVNWVWSLFLTIYHAVVSIAIPILLVELLYPGRRDEPWLGRRGMIGFSLLLSADVLFGNLVLTHYRPPATPFIAFTLLAVGLFFLARRLPESWTPSSGIKRRRPLCFGLLGFAGMLVFFLIHWIFPELGVPVMLTMVSALIVVALVLWAIRRMTAGGTWDDRHRLALASGALSFFVLLAPLAEMDKSRIDNPAGMTLVGLAAVIFLVWLRWRTYRLTKSEVSASEPIDYFSS
jgi:hypothetical protein